jgi:hypothetical protein
MVIRCGRSELPSHWLEWKPEMEKQYFSILLFSESLPLPSDYSFLSGQGNNPQFDQQYSLELPVEDPARLAYC